MASGTSQLFEDCLFALVISRDLPLTQAEELQETLEQHSGVVLDTNAKIDLDRVTHIISATSDFPQYATARLHMIPVVKPNWITQSLLRNKHSPLRPFTPDPKLFFADLNLSCADIPTGDKEAIIGAVLATGGSETSNLTRMTTHVCALTMDHPKCQQVLEKKLKCKIVLPHWFDDCLKLGKRIDEKPYLLPDPEILRIGEEEPLPCSSSAHIVGASTIKPEQPNFDNIKKLDVFKQKQVMISEDLEIGDRLRSNLENIVEAGGGIITTSIHAADMFVCQYREGRNYVFASQAGIDVGNLSWLYHLIIHNEWTSPLRRLLHYPFPRGGIPGFQETRITLSNYGGEARTYLENIVTAAGGEFTKSMKQDNTHLVTARKNSEKCNAATEWNIDMVNHLWLEESYARCEMQRLTDPRYNHFPPRTNLGEIIGETQFEPNVLQALYYSTDPTPSPSDPRPARRLVMSEKDRNSTQSEKHDEDTNMDEEDDLSSLKAKAPKRRTKSTPLFNVKTPAPNRRVSAGKENDTPSSTGSRSAKEKAMSRLHGLAPDIALYEKERKRKGSIWGGERALNKLDHEKSLERSSSPLSKREAEDAFSEEDDEEEVRMTKKAKTTNKTISRPPVEMRLMTTGMKEWPGNPSKEEAEKKKLRDMGILIVTDPSKCTHLVAPLMIRTQKFLCALAAGAIILSTDFIEACLKKGEVQSPEKFILKDPASEKKHGLKLKDVMSRARSNKRSLLRRIPIYCTKDINNGPDIYKAIVEANGGSFAIYTGRPVIKKISAEDDDGPAEPVYLITGQKPDEKKLWPKFIEMAEAGNMIPRVVTAEWLLDVAMSQMVKWNATYTLMDDR